MKSLTIQHFPNERAYTELLNASIHEISHQMSDALTAWLEELSIYNGYIISNIDDASEQISRYKEYISDDFDIEIKLNKIHLQDDHPNGLDRRKYIGIYFDICNYLQIFLIRNEIERDIISWYSTDSYDENEEYPSHTVSFGLKRSEKNTYPIDISNFQNEFHIGTIIGSRTDAGWKR